MKKAFFIILTTIMIIGCQTPQDKITKLGFKYSNDSFIKIFKSYIDKDTLKTINENKLKALNIFIDDGILKDSLVRNEFNKNTLRDIGACILLSRIELLDKLHQNGIWNKDTINKYNLLNLATEIYCGKQEKTNVNIDVIKYLIEKGANVNQLLDRKSLLFTAIKENKMDLVKLLLDNGANPDIGYRENKRSHLSPVATAIGLNKPDILKLLIKHGANLNVINKKDGFNFLMTAIVFSKKSKKLKKSDDFPLVKILVEADKSLLKNKSKAGKTALVYAFSYGRYDIAEYLLKNGANPNFIFKIGRNKVPLLFMYLVDNKIKAANLLVKYGAKVNGTFIFKGKKYSFMEAAKKLNLKRVVRYLNTHKTKDVNSISSNNTSNKNSSGKNLAKYKTTATLHFEIYDNVTCVTKSKLKVRANSSKNTVYSVDSYYHNATVMENGSDKGVRGNYSFSWSLVNDCGISTPSKNDYKNYSGSFFIDGLHSDYYIEVYNDYTKVRSN